MGLNVFVKFMNQSPLRRAIYKGGWIMEKMSETLERFDRKVKKQKAAEKYNERMRERLLTVNSPGKPHNYHTKEPQKRSSEVRIKESIKIVLQPRRSKGIFVIDLRELDNQ